MSAQTLYLIDGHAQIYRAYYAPFGNLTSPSGESTRAVHVFVQMLLNILRDRKPDYLAMTLDCADETVFRVDIDPEYKANRQPPPEDLPPQIDRIVEILDAMKIPILRLPGYEADDIMATLCQRLAGPDLDVFLVSKDKDLDQLVNDNVRLFDPGKDRVFDADALRQEKGYGPELAVEAQILMGDSTDNVKGVTGVGPKKAAQLLEKYGSVASIIEHADELTPKLKENVLAFRDRVDMTRRLVTLLPDVPFDFDLHRARIDAFDIAAARPLLERLGLRRLIDRVGTDSPAAVEKAADAPPATLFPQGATPSLFDEPIEPGDLLDAASSHADYHLVDTEAALADLAKRLAKVDAFAFDTETTGLTPAAADLVGISIAWEPDVAYYVPVLGVGTTLPVDTVRRCLGPIFADGAIHKCGQNLKYDVVVLKVAGFEVNGIDFDSMIASFVLDATRRSHGIDALAMELLNYRKIPTRDLIGSGKSQKTFAEVATDATCQYACEDADIAWRICRKFESQLTDPDLRKLFHEVELPLLGVLAEMELRGVAVDTELLAKLSGTMADRLGELEADIHKHAGRPFNINSTKQLAEVLFDERGLRVVKRTKTTRSTDAEVLAALAAESDDPIPPLVLEHREIAKLKGTYVDALPDLVCARTGRIHPSFHQTGAVTGRLSCSDPNLQNIPIRTEMGAQIRRAFVPSDPDSVLIKADYSQIELRVLAHFSGDPTLCAAFAEDRDIHAFVAAQLAGIPIEEVTKQQRSRAKTVNFGIVYGQSAFGLSRQTGMAMGEAKEFIERYFERYPRIRGFLDECVAHARRHGHVKTILGRRRDIADINSRNQNARNAAERFAANTVIQGSAADLIKVAMVNIHRRIEREKHPSRMLIQVHDELVFETPRAAVASESAMIAEEMSNAIPLSVPVKVDVAHGPNWLDLEA